MNLKTARILFTEYFTELILQAIKLGYQPAYDEITNHQGTGHKNGSLHYEGCAGDLLLYKAGVYLTKTEDYQELGKYWENLHEYCRWGGRFSKPDGNHFSFSPEELFGERA